MTIRHMRIFIEVYRTQNVTKAAEALHMTQPAVTRSIQEIEHYYGVRLFERINRRLSVTETGNALYGQALHIVDSFDKLEKGLYNWESFGLLRIGASITIGSGVLPRLLVKFRQENPHIRVETMVLNSEALQTKLLENSLDIALIENTVEKTELQATPFAGDHLVLITPPAHPLLQQAAVKLEDLLAYDLLLREPGSAGRTYLEHIFAGRGLSVHPAGISISTQSIISAVHLGLGISLLPQQLVENDIKNGNVFTKDLADVKLERQHYIVWHKNKYVSPMMKKFIAPLIDPAV